jgi:DNA-binding MarR family transcriptional regulator
MSEPDRAVRTLRSLLLLVQRLRYLFDRRLHGDGLSTSQAMLLTLTERRPDGPPSYTELADAMATSHQNVAGLAARLEALGFVDVRPDPHDRRVRRVHVTDASRAYWAARDAEDFAYVRSLFAALDDDELARFAELLDRVQDSVGEHYARVRHGEPTDASAPDPAGGR